MLKNMKSRTRIKAMADVRTRENGMRTGRKTGIRQSPLRSSCGWDLYKRKKENIWQ